MLVSRDRVGLRRTKRLRLNTSNAVGLAATLRMARIC